MWVPVKPWLVLKDVVTLNYIRLVWFEIKRLPKKGALLGGVTVSIAAWVERYVSSGEPRNATHCKHRGLQPCSRDGFPNASVTTLLWQRRISPVKLLQLCSGSLECNSSAPLGENFPSGSVTVPFFSGSHKSCYSWTTI